MNFKKKYKEDFSKNFSFDDSNININEKLTFNNVQNVKQKRKSFTLFASFSAIASLSIAIFVATILINNFSKISPNDSETIIQEQTKIDSSIFASANSTVQSNLETSIIITPEQSIVFNPTTTGDEKIFTNCILIEINDNCIYVTCSYTNPIFKDENDNILIYESTTFNNINCYKIEKGNYMKIIAYEN